MMMQSNHPLQRARTFELNKSPSMELQNPTGNQRTTTFVQPKPAPQRSKTFGGSDPNHGGGLNDKKPPLREFPTSPQLILGEEMIHFAHPQHPLSEIELRDLFTCAGCKEHGSGKRFTCRQCDFQLHEFCAFAPQILKTHPFHFQHKLLFYAKPGGILKSICDVCGKSIKGYNFRCNACSFLMHPCCAMLNTQINYPAHPHPLKLLAVTPSSSTNGDPGFVCSECKRKRSGRVYRCTVCEYHLHAVCAKSMINGLEANNIKGPEKPSMLGTAARLASQVVIEFIGGLIEGLGEGVGEALGSNVVSRGRRSVNKRN